MSSEEQELDANQDSLEEQVSPATVGEVCEAFWRIEQEEDLYNWEVLGIRLWPLVRFRVFYNLTKNSGTYKWKDSRPLVKPADYPVWTGTMGHKELWRNITGWRWYLRGIIPDSMRDSRVPKWLKATDMISPFSNRDARGVDRFMQPVIDALGDQAIRFGVGSWDRESEWPQIDRFQGIFRKRWGNIASVYVRLRLKKEDYAKYRRVIAYLEKASRSSAGPYRNFPRWTLRNFLAERHGYRIFFKRVPIKRLFIVNASRMLMMAAAQDSGVKVIELQCGVFSKYNMQFSWPGRPEIPYLPNEIWTWGKYWTDGIDNSGSQEIVVAGATEEFEAIRERVLGVGAGASNPIKRVANTIVVMSQPLIGGDLFAASLKLARLLPEYQLVFKPHPKDEQEDFDAALAADGQGMPANLVMAPEGKSSLELLAESEICLGVFSATLIEAAGLGNRVGILKLAGWEHLSPLINGGHAHAFDTVEELAAGVPNLPNPGDPYYFYGKRADLAELLRTR